MGRRRFVPNPKVPYHIVSRANNRIRFPLPMEVMWDIFSRHLFALHHFFDAQITSFVLMPNHYHLIAKFPEGNVSSAMMYVLREISREISNETRQINHQFGQRFFRCAIERYHYFNHAYKYVYLNPVAAGLIKAPEDYPYSTLPGLLGHTKLLFPVAEDTLLFDDPDRTLRWLNRPVKESARMDIRNALRKSTFALCKVRKGPNPLETEMF